jgi:hypothetical protein
VVSSLKAQERRRRADEIMSEPPTCVVICVSTNANAFELCSFRGGMSGGIEFQGSEKG